MESAGTDACARGGEQEAAAALAHAEEQLWSADQVPSWSQLWCQFSAQAENNAHFLTTPPSLRSVWVGESLGLIYPKGCHHRVLGVHSCHADDNQGFIFSWKAAVWRFFTPVPPPRALFDLFSPECVSASPKIAWCMDSQCNPWSRW